MSNFIQNCLSGDALLEEIDDYVDMWHDGDGKQSLRDFLGLNEKEYSLYVRDEEMLGQIVAARHKEIPIVKFLQMDVQNLAARSTSSKKSTIITEWLKSEGLWD
jgi:hypothetical protein